MREPPTDCALRLLCAAPPSSPVLVFLSNTGIIFTLSMTCGVNNGVKWISEKLWVKAATTENDVLISE